MSKLRQCSKCSKFKMRNIYRTLVKKFNKNAGNSPCSKCYLFFEGKLKKFFQKKVGEKNATLVTFVILRGFFAFFFTTLRIIPTTFGIKPSFFLLHFYYIGSKFP